MSILPNISFQYIRLLAVRPALTLFNKLESSGRTLQNGPSEEKIKSVLEKTFPSANLIQVDDISGGCGAMFEISVEAAELKGLSIIKQHRLVTEALKEEIKDMHGLRIHTSVPS